MGSTCFMFGKMTDACKILLLCKKQLEGLRYGWKDRLDQIRLDQISNWVQGLSAPTHLHLNRRALCAPYRIMGAVAPRHNILITSGSKKGTQIYFFFSLKSPRKRTMDGRIIHVHILNIQDVGIVTGFIWFKIVLHCNYCSWAV